MKTAAAFALHYGVEYFRQAIEAVAPVVDRIIVAYTPSPSYGYGADSPCPESEEQLLACCAGVKNLLWMKSLWGSEGNHRRAYEDTARRLGVDVLAIADSDELWDTTDLERCIRQAHDGSAARYPIKGFVHFWRSFDRCCRDVWEPVRLLNLNQSGPDKTLDARIHHMGYAQAARTIAYKVQTHGHRAEWRPEWMNEIFLTNRQTDLHPVVRNWWNAEPFDKKQLPACLKSHLNFAKAIIEYADFWRLVRLSGFAECAQNEVDHGSDNTYIFYINNGNADEIARQPRKARFILWQLERPLHGSEGHAPRIFDDVWVSDVALADALAKLCGSYVRYVTLGGHSGLGGERKAPVWDLTHQSYLTYRRQAIVNDLINRGFAIGPNAWGQQRDKILASSRAGLCTHQDELQVIEPLRATLFACWGLPLICEPANDWYPYKTHPLDGQTFQSIRELDGEENRRRMTGEMNFRKCVEGALGVE